MEKDIHPLTANGLDGGIDGLFDGGKEGNRAYLFLVPVDVPQNNETRKPTGRDFWSVPNQARAKSPASPPSPSQVNAS